MELDVITLYRERLRINGKLTNCQTGDRLVTIKTLTLKNPLPPMMSFAHFTGRVIHFGQPRQNQGPKQIDKCTKCLENGHKKSDCTNDWKCLACNKSGHRKGECNLSEAEATDSPSSTPLLPDETVGKTGSDTKRHDTKGKGSPKKKKKHAKQGLLDSFVTKTGSANVTPNKDRRKNVNAKDRSPPTPAEVLAKNPRIDSSESESDTDIDPNSE